MSSIGEGGLFKDVDQESQQEIEKELLEALESHDNIVPTHARRGPALGAANYHWRRGVLV